MSVRSRLARLPLRTRLTAGFSAAMLLVLSAAGAFVYWRVHYALDRGLDAELSQAVATIAPLVGPSGALDAAGRRAASATGTTWQVLGPDGAVLAGSPSAPAAPLVDPEAAGQAGVVDVGALLPADPEPYRVRVEPLDGATLLVGLRRDRRDEALRELLLQLSLAGLGALVVTALVGDLLARAALRPVEDYRRRAASIASGAADVRLAVPASRDDEVTRLGHTLNDMLAAQDRALERERRFVQEASHELRTPLTLLRGRIQLARRRERGREELEVALDELLVDVDRLADLADHLLEVGRLEGARSEAPPDGAVDAAAESSCDPHEVVATAVGRLAPEEPDGTAQVMITLEAGPAGPVRVGLRAADLERAVANLVANARLHGTPPIAVNVRTDHGWVVVEVVDDGEGMPAPLLDVATHRFTRADEARSRPGAGLGLALVESLVAGAGGELRLCAHGRHVSHPVPQPVACRHGATMTATLVLPALPGLVERPS